jgi:putative hydrolase of the HAD superfamily
MNNHIVVIDWDHIDTVLLDMDGTLLDLHFDNHFWQEYLPQRYALQHDVAIERAREQLMTMFAAQRGNLNWYCVDYWSRELQLDIAELKREIEHLISIRPHVEEFLQRLHASPRQIWLVTNAHRKSLDIKMRRTGIERWFDRIISSHDLNAPKEAKDFWRQLHDKYRFDPARTLLIDDTATVLQAAQDFGIRHLLTLFQPDSRQAKRIDTEFPGILHFDEIMPMLPT